MARLQINPILTDTAHKYHKGWMQDKIKYTELTSSHLSKVDREHVTAILAGLYSGTKTKEWVQTLAHERTKAGQPSLWFYTIMDMMGGRVGLLKFKGIEVALFFKRQTTELVMQPGSPLPEHPIEDPDDVWQRLDLMGPSARRSRKLHITTRVDGAAELRDALNALRQQYTDTEAELREMKRLERLRKEAIQEAKDKEEAKTKRPFAPVPERDRLCMDCGCYENVHTFDKKGRCKGCTGQKPASKRWKVACKDCTFRPKGQRRKKHPKAGTPPKHTGKRLKTRPRRFKRSKKQG